MALTQFHLSREALFSSFSSSLFRGEGLPDSRLLKNLVKDQIFLFLFGWFWKLQFWECPTGSLYIKIHLFGCDPIRQYYGSFRRHRCSEFLVLILRIREPLAGVLS